jgi:hypothetical protein
MKNIKMTAAKSLFLIALFCPIALAEGDQGSGGFANGDGTVVRACELSVDGDQGSGGLTAGTCEETSYVDTVISAIYAYLDSMV